jgi:primary-amine oxidase
MPIAREDRVQVAVPVTSHSGPSSEAPHPLDPLSPDELARAVAVVRDAEGAALRRFVRVRLAEPAKPEYLGWLDGGAAPPRRALLSLVDAERRVVETVVDLATRQIAARRMIDGAHPPITAQEFSGLGDVVRADPLLAAALARRGITELHKVHVVICAAGAFDHPLESGGRIARALCYLREEPGDNSYQRPIESMIAFVDLDQRRVLAVEEIDEKPIPDADGDYRAGVVPPREDLRPIEISQPEGASFSVSGSRIAWHRWTLGARIDAQEGLVLDDVRYDGRAILHRASCPEMTVPYGERHPMHSWRNYFDAGEYGLGSMVNSLALGCDCVGDIRYLDAHLVDDDGAVRTIANAICLHEEDAGLLWKHTDDVTGTVEVRRNRRLVVNSMVTVGNYDYAFRWYLGLDGSIEAEVQLHGVPSTMAVANGEQPVAANMVDRGLAAPHHQHLFCFRLDFDVDGTPNRVVEVEAQAVPVGPESPLGNVFRAARRVFRTEDEAHGEADDRRSRSWHVESAERANAHGAPTAYRITPLHGTATLLAQPDSSVGRRAGYAQHTFWATAYDADELHPASSYPYQQRDPVGLPQWSARGRSIEDDDVVIWYVAGTTHFVRPEEWPVMPVARASVLLEPYGFFDRNPTLDVPPPHACRHG